MINGFVLFVCWYGTILSNDIFTKASFKRISITLLLTLLYEKIGKNGKNITSKAPSRN